MSNEEFTQAVFPELRTPSLILDVDRVRRNAARVAGIADRHGVRLRPHIKTHKSAEIARLQSEGREPELTASTLAEVRAMCDQGFRDFHYAVPIEPGKLADLVLLERDPLAMPVDELAGVKPLATMLGGRWVFDRR